MSDLERVGALIIVLAGAVSGFQLGRIWQEAAESHRRRMQKLAKLDAEIAAIENELEAYRRDQVDEIVREAERYSRGGE